MDISKPVENVLSCTKEIDTVLAGVRRGDGNKLVDATIAQEDSGLLFPSLMNAFYSTYTWPVVIHSKGESNFLKQKGRIKKELEIVERRLSKLGVDQLKEISPSDFNSHLLALGIVVHHALADIEISEGNKSRDKNCYGANGARFYGSNLDKPRLYANQMQTAAAQTTMLLDQSAFFIRIGDHESMYEKIRNRNLARQMLTIFDERVPSLVSLAQTNAEILRDILPESSLRTFSYSNYKTGEHAPKPADILESLAQWIDRAQDVTDNAQSTQEQRYELARLAMRYNNIHPWTDGNGRSLTVENNRFRVSSGMDPVYVPKVHNLGYIEMMKSPKNLRDIGALARFYDRFTMPHEQFKDKMHEIISLS